jgi:hypothetical protein
METKNREKILLMATGAFAVLYLLNLLVISPLIDSWHSRSDEIVKLKKQIADGAVLVQRGPVIQDRWDAMRGNALSNNPTAAERQMFTAFDHWVSAGGVAEGSFRPQIQEGDSNFTTVDCRSDVTGSLDSVRDFLKAMSRDPLADKVESFELTSKDDDGRQLTLGLSMSGLILTDSDPSSVPPVAGPQTPAPSQETNSPLNADSDPFRIISRNTIFDQSRIDRGNRERPATRQVKVETITARGSVIDPKQGSEFFDGSGVRSAKFYDVGSTVGDFTVAKVTIKTVTLTNSSSNTFVLPTDGSASLRRDDEGPWHLSGSLASIPTAETTTLAIPSAEPAAGSIKDSVLERLMKRRMEEK